jgi:WD40 repeat protein
MVLRGAAKGILPGAVGFFLFHLVVFASYCFSLIGYDLFEIVIPVVLLVGGVYGAAIGLVIGWASGKEGVNIGFRRVCLWMVLGGLASLGVSELLWLVDFGNGALGDPIRHWPSLLLFSAYGAIVGPVVGVSLRQQPKARKTIMRVVYVIEGLIGLYVLLAAIATVSSGSTEALGPVYCVAVFPDGKKIISGHQDSTVRVWDADTGALLQRWSVDRPAVVAVAGAPDGRQVAFGPGLHIWDLETHRPGRGLTGQLSGVTSVAFSSDGRILAAGGRDHSVRVWDAATGTQLHCFTGHKAHVNSVKISSDNRFIVSGGGDYSGGRINDPSVRLWDLKTGRELPRLEGEADVTNCVALSPDNRYVASAGWDKGVLVWDTASGKRTHQFSSGRTNCVAFTTDGKRIISGNQKGTIQIWDMEQEREIAHLQQDEGEIWGLAVMPDGARLVTCSGSWMVADRQVFRVFVQQGAIPLGCSIRIWDLKVYREVRQLGLAGFPKSP